ncbi:hypothetical protein ACJJIQ_01225 [Microbulbifer sp. ANSA003]|uniref:hypothetical protein n=1 Tax=Microbulbifer sp. ANSA003 TaxID=3243360 RepID=UPI004042928D
MNHSESPAGRALKATAAVLQRLQSATAIRGEPHLTSLAFKIRRDITELFRSTLDTFPPPTSTNLQKLVNACLGIYDHIDHDIGEQEDTQKNNI